MGYHHACVCMYVYTQNFLSNNAAAITRSTEENNGYSCLTLLISDLESQVVETQEDGGVKAGVVHDFFLRHGHEHAATKKKGTKYKNSGRYIHHTPTN